MGTLRDRGEVGGKACRSCARFLPLDDFHRRADCLYGCAPCCRRCMNTARNERRAAWSPEQWAEHKRASREWLRANPDVLHRAVARWRAANPEKVRAYSRLRSRKFRQQNPELNLQRIRESRAKKPDLYRRLQKFSDLNYKARKRGAKRSRVSSGDLKRLLSRWGGKCAYCTTRAADTFDHVHPLARGGSHSIGNLLPACRSCNSSKRHQFLFEWRQRHSHRVAA